MWPKLYHIFCYLTNVLSACDQYSVPNHIASHIELITPTLHFDVKIEPIQPPRIKRKRSPDNVPVQGASRNIGQPGAGNSPKTTGKIKNIIGQLENCDEQITLDCLRALYDVVYKPIATSKNSYGIVEYTPQAYLQSDLGWYHTF